MAETAGSNPARRFMKETPIAILMGSDSDRDKVAPCLKVLQEQNIQYDSLVMSAHRQPDNVRVFAMDARKAGYKVIIAAAGLSNALAGVCAAHSDLPVIGLPLNAGSLGGMDALLSTVQMPPGVPVASVGIDNARNAAWLAIRILSIT